MNRINYTDKGCFLYAPMIVALGEQDVMRHDFVQLIGKKAANLCELSKIEGIAVPEGFVITANSFDYFLSCNNLLQEIQCLNRLYKQWKNGNQKETLKRELKKKAKELRNRIVSGNVPPEFKNEISDYYQQLGFSQRNFSVAVRSSALFEDMPGHSFAGQYDTYLNILNITEVIYSIKRCWASLYNDTIIDYCDGLAGNASSEENLFLKMKMAVIVQRKINAQYSGVGFNVDRKTGQPGVYLEINYGLGESIVQGLIKKPETWILDSPADFVKYADSGYKDREVISTPTGGTQINEVTETKRNSFALAKEQALDAGKKIGCIAGHFSAHMNNAFIDTEFAWEDGKLYFLQYRPETVFSNHKIMELIEVVDENKTKEQPLLQEGECVWPGTGVGRAFIFKLSMLPDEKEIEKIISECDNAEILICNKTIPALEPIMRNAKAIITENIGINSHAAIIGSEEKIPTIVGMSSAIQRLKPVAAKNNLFTVDAYMTRVFSGEQPLTQCQNIDKENIDMELDKKKTKINDAIGYNQLNCKIYRGVFGRLQYELHALALDYLGEKIGTMWPYYEEVTSDDVTLYTYFNDGLQIVESFRRMDFTHLLHFFEERQKMVKQYINIARSFDGSSGSVKEFIHAHIAFIGFLHSRWFFEKILEYTVLEIKQKIPFEDRHHIDYLFNQYRNIGGAERHTRKSHWINLINTVRDSGLLSEPNPLESVHQEKYKKVNAKINEFRMAFPDIDNQDMRQPLPHMGSFFKLLTNNPENISETKIMVKQIISDYFIKYPHLKLYIDAVIQKEEEHIIQFRTQLAMRKKLLKVGQKLQNAGFIEKPEAIFELTPKTLMELISVVTL